MPAPDGDALFRAPVEAARRADTAIVVVGSGPTTESEGFDRPGLALPGDQDELVRRVAEVNDRTVVVVNTGWATPLGSTSRPGRNRSRSAPLLTWK